MTLGACLVKTSRRNPADKHVETPRNARETETPAVSTLAVPNVNLQTISRAAGTFEESLTNPSIEHAVTQRNRLIPVPRSTGKPSVRAPRSWLGRFLLRQDQANGSTNRLERNGHEASRVSEPAPTALNSMLLVPRVETQPVAPSKPDVALHVSASPAAKCEAPAAAAIQAQTAKSRDRRAFPRRHSGSKVSVVRPVGVDGTLTSQRLDWLLHGSSLKGQLTDISMNGIAFSLSESLEAGEEVYLRATGAKGTRTHQLRAEVVRSTQDNDAWNIQCRLQKKLDLEAVQELGQNLFTSNVV